MIQSVSKRIAFVVPVIFVFLTAFLTANHAHAQNEGRLNGTADYAFTNGKIYTMNEAQPWAEAMTIEGAEFTYVGDASGLKSHIGFGTEVIDLDGKVLMPGFVDGHTHPMAGAMLGGKIAWQ